MPTTEPTPPTRAAPPEPEPLKRIPVRRESMQSWGIVIEWDYPKPSKPVGFKPNMENWYRRLSPLKSTPDRRARVLRDLPNKDIARSRCNNIRNSLRERDPKSKWKIESAKADDGTYGIWVTYGGVMSNEEYAAAEALRAKRSVLAKERMAKAERKRALQRSRLNPSLRPPVVRPGD